MTSALDLVFLAVLAVAWPLYEYFVDWSTFQRWLREKPRQARRYEYGRAFGVQWLLAAAGAALWMRAGRPLSALGLHSPEGWRLWVSAVLVLLLSALHGRQAVMVARSPRLREYLRRRLADLRFGELLPRTTAELGGFIALSLTAGVCE